MTLPPPNPNEPPSAAMTIGRRQQQMERELGSLGTVLSGEIKRLGAQLDRVEKRAEKRNDQTRWLILSVGIVVAAVEIAATGTLLGIAVGTGLIVMALLTGFLAFRDDGTARVPGENDPPDAPTDDVPAQPDILTFGAHGQSLPRDPEMRAPQPRPPWGPAYPVAPPRESPPNPPQRTPSPQPRDETPREGPSTARFPLHAAVEKAAERKDQENK